MFGPPDLGPTSAESTDRRVPRRGYRRFGPVSSNSQNRSAQLAGGEQDRTIQLIGIQAVALPRDLQRRSGEPVAGIEARGPLQHSQGEDAFPSAGRDRAALE